MYDKGLLYSKKFNIPIISVGNLTVGGTGKTPHVEFLLDILKGKKVAMLSRGYKRNTKGFLVADDGATSQTIGDEPFQIFRKFKNITVAVDEKRVHGINQLMRLQPDLDVVVLDDAFQHRAVNPGLKILLTDYSRLYIHDSMLPGGLLRESISGSKRADIIIVTKCKSTISELEMALISKQIAPLSHQTLYFSTIEYADVKPVFETENRQKTEIKLADTAILLVTGIVSPTPIIEELTTKSAKVEAFSFPDHHHFTPNNYAEIEQKYIHLQSEKKIVLVTEKDAARLVTSVSFPETLKSVTYYLPIRIKILQNKQPLFIQNILNYVETYTGNC